MRERHDKLSPLASALGNVHWAFLASFCSWHCVLKWKEWKITNSIIWLGPEKSAAPESERREQLLWLLTRVCPRHLPAQNATVQECNIHVYYILGCIRVYYIHNILHLLHPGLCRCVLHPLHPSLYVLFQGISVWVTLRFWHGYPRARTIFVRPCPDLSHSSSSLPWSSRSSSLPWSSRSSSLPWSS